MIKVLILLSFLILSQFVNAQLQWNFFTEINTNINVDFVKYNHKHQSHYGSSLLVSSSIGRIKLSVGTGMVNHSLKVVNEGSISHAKYKLISINTPFLFQINTVIRPKYCFGIQFGVMKDKLIRKKAFFIYENGKMENRTIENDITGFNLQLGINYDRKISEKLSLCLSPFLNLKSPNSIYNYQKDPLGTSQSEDFFVPYSKLSYGLRFGIICEWER